MGMPSAEHPQSLQAHHGTKLFAPEAFPGISQALLPETDRFSRNLRHSLVGPE
jgi:hypothetical protein